MKKVVSLLLVLVLVIGMATVGSAAVLTGSSLKITDASGLDLGAYTNGNTVTFDPAPDSTYKIWLSAQHFLWEGTAATAGILAANGQGPANYGVTLSQLRKGKVTVRSSVRSGSKLLKSAIALDEGTGNATLGKTAYIKIKFVDPLRSVDEEDYEYSVYLVVDGDHDKDNAVLISGTMENGVDQVDDLDDFASTDEGHTVLEGVAYNKLVEVDVGEGVSVWTKIFNNKKYWGYATRDADEADDVVFAKYPDIDSVFTLDSIGLNSTAQYVVLNDVGGDFYVYDKDLKFIGMSNEHLPYSTKYYLANKKLSIDDDTDEPDDIDDGDEPEPPPVTGGDDYVDNINDNPGTGR